MYYTSLTDSERAVPCSKLGRFLATAEEPRSWATASRCCGSPTTPTLWFPRTKRQFLAAYSWSKCLLQCMSHYVSSNDLKCLTKCSLVHSILVLFLGTGLCLCTWEALAVPGRPGPLCSCALWPLLPQWATTAAHWRRSGKVTKSYDVPPRKHWVPPYLDGKFGTTVALLECGEPQTVSRKRGSLTIHLQIWAKTCKNYNIFVCFFSKLKLLRVCLLASLTTFADGVCCWGCPELSETGMQNMFLSHFKVLKFESCFSK